MPLGLFADATYEQQRIDLAADDLILTYTDGVTESMNLAEEEFGENRLKEIIVQHDGGGAKRVLDAVLDAVGIHTGGADQFDDLTLLVLRWSRDKGGAAE